MIQVTTIQRLLLCIAFFARCALGTAATEAPDPTISFRAVQLSGQPAPLFIDQQGEWVRCLISKRRISGSLVVKGTDNHLAFYTRAGDRDENGRPLDPPAAVVQLPTGSRNVLLLFSSQRTATDKLRIVALPRDDLHNLRGQTILYNFSSYPIVGEVAQQRFSIERGNHVILQPTADKSNNLNLRLARYAQENWNVAFSTVWGNMPDVNTLFFVYDAEAGKDAIDVRRFYDSPLSTPDPNDT